MKLIHNRSLDVIVVGAGLAGLVSASHLQRLGMRVQVYDKSSDLGGRLAATRRRRGQTTCRAENCAGTSLAIRSLQRTPGECWWDPLLRLGLAGDWCSEADAQGATSVPGRWLRR